MQIKREWQIAARSVEVVLAAPFARGSATARRARERASVAEGSWIARSPLNQTGRLPISRWARRSRLSPLRLLGPCFAAVAGAHAGARAPRCMQALRSGSSAPNRGGGEPRRKASRRSPPTSRPKCASSVRLRRARHGSRKRASRLNPGIPAPEPADRGPALTFRSRGICRVACVRAG